MGKRIEQRACENLGPTSERPRVPPGWCPCSYTPPWFCVSSSSSHRCLFWGVSEADAWPGMDPRAGQGFELQNPGLGLAQFMERWPMCGETLRGLASESQAINNEDSNFSECSPKTRRSARHCHVPAARVHTRPRDEGGQLLLPLYRKERRGSEV